MKFLVARLVVCGVLVFALGAEAGQAAVVRVPATPVDTYIRDGSFANTNFFATTLSVGSSTTASTKRRSLMIFPVADYLPAGASVTSASMGLYVSARATTKAISVGAYALTRAWKDSVTWNSAASGTAWTTVGGDYQPAALSTNASVGGALGTASWPIPAATVTAWANPSGANLGVLLKQTAEGGANSNVLTIESADASDTTRRPYVDVTYTPSAQTPAPAALAFIGTHDRGAPKGVWVANADGTSPRLVVPGSSTSPAGGLGLALSPDGNLVAYSANNKIFVKSIATGTTTMVYNGPTPGEVRGVHFAPQGDYLIFLGDVTSATIGRVLTVNTDGTTLEQVPIGSAAAGYPRDVSFAPDGQHIVFVSSASQQGYDAGIWIAEADGQNPRRIVYTDPFTRDTTLRHPRFEPAGDAITYVQTGQLKSAMFNGELRPSYGGIPVGRSPLNPEWSGDATQLYYEWAGATNGLAAFNEATAVSTDLFTSFALMSLPAAPQPVDDGSAGAADDEPDAPIDDSLYDDTCYDVNEAPVACPPGAGARGVGPAAAAAPPVEHGISDSNDFSSFNLFTNVRYLRLQAPFVRRIVPWNVARIPARLLDLQNWVAAATAAGKRPLISLGHCIENSYTRTPGPGEVVADAGKQLPCRPSTVGGLPNCGCTSKVGKELLLLARPPTPGEYEGAVRALVTASGMAGVEQYTAWNEPNLTNKEPTAATTSELKYSGSVPMMDPATLLVANGAPLATARARLAGRFYGILKAACAARTPSPCTVLAGDFSDLNMPHAATPGTRGRNYLLQYRKTIGPTPDFWAWHAYKDIKTLRGAPADPPAYSRLKAFLSATRTSLSGTGPQVVLTEQGVISRQQGKNVSLLDPQRSSAAFVGLDGVSSRISRVYYYAMLGSDSFDSGLLSRFDPQYKLATATYGQVCLSWRGPEPDCSALVP